MLYREAIIKELGCYFNMAHEMLMSKSGKDKRHIAMELAYRYTNENQMRE